VHAALADAYLDTGQEALALDHFRQAVTANPGNASWQFRYGRLLVANGHDALARQPLAKAVELGEQASPRPLWLWEAHHMMARALGSQPQAIQHWEQFLRTGPIDSPYRSEAIRELKRLGRPWSGT
jgi:Tfp pilus assembly protein PilF